MGDVYTVHSAGPIFVTVMGYCFLGESFGLFEIGNIAMVLLGDGHLSTLFKTTRIFGKVPVFNKTICFFKCEQQTFGPIMAFSVDRPMQLILGVILVVQPPFLFGGTAGSEGKLAP